MKFKLYNTNIISKLETSLKFQNIMKVKCSKIKEKYIKHLLHH